MYQEKWSAITNVCISIQKANKQTNIVRLCCIVVVLHVKYFTILYKSLNLLAQGRLLNKLLDSVFLEELLLGHGAVIKCVVLPQACNQLHIDNCNPTHVAAGLSEIYSLWCKPLWQRWVYFWFCMFACFILLLLFCFSLAEYISVAGSFIISWLIPKLLLSLFSMELDSHYSFSFH